MRTSFILMVTAALIPAASHAQLLDGIFHRPKETPKLVFDFTGSSPVVSLAKRDGLGKTRLQRLGSDGEIRLVPGSAVKIMVYSGSAVAVSVKPADLSGIQDAAELLRDMPGGKDIALPLVHVTRNVISSDDKNVDGGSKTTTTSGQGLQTTRFFVPYTSLENHAPTKLNRPGLDTTQKLDVKQDGNFLAIKDPGSVNVLPDGSTVVEVISQMPDGSYKSAKATVLAATKWSFENTFSPYFEVDRHTSIRFAATDSIINLGSNQNFRLETVAVFSPNSSSDSSAKADNFIGLGASFSTFLGSQFKQSGRTFFGFPLRLTFTAGLIGLSPNQHQKGTGTPFYGIGFAIPVGS